LKAHTQPARQRPEFRFGLGTLIAVIAVVSILASGWLKDKNPPSLLAGQIVYEADAQGRMRRVDAPSASVQIAPPRLWKPEVALLLERAPDLQLTPAQRQKVRALNASWLQEKRRLQSEIEQAASGAAESLQAARLGKSLSLAQIRQGLGDYSSLSQTYDARRVNYWALAMALLTAQQQAKLGRLLGAHQEQRP
jgi:hypothetical protein